MLDPVIEVDTPATALSSRRLKHKYSAISLCCAERLSSAEKRWYTKGIKRKGSNGRDTKILEMKEVEMGCSGGCLRNSGRINRGEGAEPLGFGGPVLGGAPRVMDSKGSSPIAPGSGPLQDHGGPCYTSWNRCHYQYSAAEKMQAPKKCVSSPD